MSGVEDFFGVGFGDMVGEGESEVFGDELFDVGVFDVFGFFDFNNVEDLDVNC